MNKIGLAIHGGATSRNPEQLSNALKNEYIENLDSISKKTFSQISNGMSAIDAVQFAVTLLEDCPLFNAGKGSVFNHKGEHELDAAIMCGKTQHAGAITCVKGVKNPIKLAREVLNDGNYVLLCGSGAEEFAKLKGIEFKEADYFYVEELYNEWLSIKDTDLILLDYSSNQKFGTVGAVALDTFGNLASATSTGGLTNKKYGRIGDSPIIGSGTYANNNTCAISCTGYGEIFLRNLVAFDVSCLMDYKGLSLKDACKVVINEKLNDSGGIGGLIGIDNYGNIEYNFNSKGMFKSITNTDGKIRSSIF
jgi:beta-aspartyl-peptidase (threonine type)